MIVYLKAYANHAYEGVQLIATISVCSVIASFKCLFQAENSMTGRSADTSLAKIHEMSEFILILINK